MTEAYKVGITIALNNFVSRGLFAIRGDLAKTDAAAKKLNATLKEIKLLGIGGAILGGVGYTRSTRRWKPPRSTSRRSPSSRASTSGTPSTRRRTSSPAGPASSGPRPPT